MGLRDMYAYAIQTAKGKFHGNAEEHDGKLYFKGTVATEAEKNEIWNAIKTIPDWRNEIVADITVTGGGGAPEVGDERGQRIHRPVAQLEGALLEWSAPAPSARPPTSGGRSGRPG